MRKIFSFFFKHILFFLAYFALNRLIYLLYQIREIKIHNIEFQEAIASFYYGLRLDLSTSIYLLLIPFLLIVFQLIIRKDWINLIQKAYLTIIILFYSLLIVSELGIYEEWKTKMHYKVLLYLSNPAEIYNTVETDKFFILISAFILLFSLSLWVYRKWIYTPLKFKSFKLYPTLLFGVLTPIILVIGARGGLQEIPINQSQSYYSKHNILNLAAVNSGFNIYVSVFENYKNFGTNPFIYYSFDEANTIIKNIYKQDETPTYSQILKIDRPNIVLIILESWSATLIESLGGNAGITPQFRELEKEGLLFTNIYSSGSRSEQGIASILSGFPAHPISSVTVQPNKFINLPTLNHVLMSQDYTSSFLFGGQLIYGNIKSYIIYNKFEIIKEVSDFPELPKGKLGIHDEYMFNEHLKNMDQLKEPFFTGLYTVSTHSPFDMPMEQKLKWGGNLNAYLNSAYYTDQSLGTYLKEAKTKEWFKNTLFIIVADHSHHSYTYDPYHSKEYHQIPLLLFGEVIKDEFKGKQINKLGNHHDIIGTILPQLGLSNELEPFVWTKNLLDSNAPEYAYIAFEEGLGWVRPSGQFFYDNRVDKYYLNTIPAQHQDSIIKEGKSYLQLVFQDYLDR